MKRGSIIILVVGLLVAAALAGGIFWFLSQPSSSGTTTSSGEAGETAGEATPEPSPTPDPGVEILVARGDIPSGTVLQNEENLLRRDRIPTDEYAAKSSSYFTDFDEIQGKVISKSLRDGDRIERGALSEPGLSQAIPTPEPDISHPKAYPLLVDSIKGVADQIKPDDFVDVIATFTLQRTDVNGQIQEYRTTKTIVQRAQVLRIVRPPPPPSDEGGSSAGASGGAAAPAAPAPTAAPAPAANSGGTPQLGPDGQPIGQAGSAPAIQSREGPANITPGEWILILAVDDQEAEVLEFALAYGARISLVLRGFDDGDQEQTIGSSLDLLISQLGVPLPQPLPPLPPQ